MWKLAVATHMLWTKIGELGKADLYVGILSLTVVVLMITKSFLPGAVHEISGCTYKSSTAFSVSVLSLFEWRASAVVSPVSHFKVRNFTTAASFRGESGFALYNNNKLTYLKSVAFSSLSSGGKTVSTESLAERWIISALAVQTTVSFIFG